jgi:hypothetical protein
MKNIYKIILFLLLPLKLFGTAQEPDLIIYKGDTLFLHACPLGFYPNRELINTQNLFESKLGSCSTGCWRGYIAVWEIDDNKLYLTKIKNHCYLSYMSSVDSYKNAGIGIDSIGSEFADLKMLFPERYENGKVRADWMSGKLISPQGNLLYYIHSEFESVYERELAFNIENGLLVGTEWFDNSKTKKSKYTEDTKLLSEFIYSNINYNNLPKSDTIKGRVTVLIISSDDNGKIDSVQVVRGINEIYDAEAVRVIKSIPEWEVIYRHGKRINHLWTVPIKFDMTEKKE